MHALDPYASGFVRRPHLKDDYTRGFLTHGLFKYSRHPNFFAEQCIWCSYYVFAVASSWYGESWDGEGEGSWEVRSWEGLLTKGDLI